MARSRSGAAGSRERRSWRSSRSSSSSSRSSCSCVGDRLGASRRWDRRSRWRPRRSGHIRRSSPRTRRPSRPRARSSPPTPPLATHPTRPRRPTPALPTAPSRPRARSSPTTTPQPTGPTPTSRPRKRRTLHSPTRRRTRQPSPTGETHRDPGALMGLVRMRPSREILSGDSADVYFARAASVLEREGLDPVVTMEVFARQDAILCGIDEAKNLIGHALADCDPPETRVEGLDDGDRIEPKEIVLRIHARYRQFGLYEIAILGMLAQSTGWATAARECVEAAAPEPVVSFGARHVHPDITDVLDYAAIVGGCVGAS